MTSSGRVVPLPKNPPALPKQWEGFGSHIMARTKRNSDGLPIGMLLGFEMPDGSTVYKEAGLYRVPNGQDEWRLEAATAGGSQVPTASRTPASKVTTPKPQVGNPKVWKHPTLHLAKDGPQTKDPWIVGDVRRYLAEPPPPVEWLVEGLIPAGMPGILAARANAGKSMLALEIGMCLAAGLRVMGRAVTPGAARGVLFVGLEDDEPEFHRRMHRGLALLEEDPEWTPAHRKALEERFVPLFPHYSSGQSFSLKTQLQTIVEKAAAIPGGCGLIVLDTLARMVLGDENNAKDMRPFNEAASALVQVTGASVLSIHHVGKGNDAPSDKKLWERLHPEALRGSSSVEAAARWILQLAVLTPAEALAANLDSISAMNGTYVALGLTKMNAAEKGQMVLLERRHSNEPGAGFLCPHPDSEQILAVIHGASAVLKLNREQKVLLVIAEAGGSLVRVDKDVEAATIFAGNKAPSRDWNKAVSYLRKEGWLQDLTITELGWAKAQVLGFHGTDRNTPIGADPSIGPGSKGIPLARNTAEYPEHDGVFRSKALDNRNGTSIDEDQLQQEGLL